MKALSIRQPWAWLIVHGHKPIENRTWFSHYRGPLLIHASKGMTRDEYTVALTFTWQATDDQVTLPPFEELQRGGIVGSVMMIGCVDESFSPWFVGPFGFVLLDAKITPFRPCKGSLGIFNVPEILP